MGNQTGDNIEYEIEQLLPIVSELSQKYTNYESTSVTYEKAQSLMEAVLYCLNEYSSSSTISPVQSGISVKEQYRLGLRLLYEKVEAIRMIFNEVSSNFDDYEVKCLYDTVQKGIPQFLKWYDIEFCPQNTILSLDYPLLKDYNPLKGADAVYEYIRGIQTEQTFLGAFDRGYVVQVLEKYNLEYRDMVENICGIVLINIIGHVAVKKPLFEPVFSNEEYIQLSKIFEGKSVMEIENAVRKIQKEIVTRFFGNDNGMLEYLCCEAGNIAIRIFTANQYRQLNRFFV